jgi:hypothetical protein
MTRTPLTSVVGLALKRTLAFVLLGSLTVVLGLAAEGRLRQQGFPPSLVRARGQAAVRAQAFGNSEYCGNCHRDIYQQWSASAHHFSSFNNPFYRKVALDVLEHKGDRAFKSCAGCHDPLPLVGRETESLDLDGWTANAGITCLACHRVVEAHPRDADYVIDPPTFVSFDLSERPALRELHDGVLRMAPWMHRATMSHPVQRSAEFCASCHTQTVPPELNGARRLLVQDEYPAWKASVFARRPYASCGDCHMRLVPSDDPAARNGKVKSHSFAASNTALPALTRDDAHLEEVETFLRSGAVTLAIKRLAVAPGGGGSGSLTAGRDVELTVEIGNRGVGHGFPAGTVDSNEAWIAVEVLDGRGTDVFRSGALGADGSVDPAAVTYRTVFADRHGRETDRRTTSSEAASVVSSRRIPAGGTDVAGYRFRIPAGARSPLNVKARLMWRKFSPEFTRWVFDGRPVPPLPITVMAEGAQSFALATTAASRY